MEKIESLYISHLFEDNDVAKLVKKQGLGIETINFSMSDKLDKLEESIEEYGRWLEEIGGPNLTLHGPFLDLNPITFDREIRKVVMKRYRQAARACSSLGGKKVVLHTGFHPDIYFLVGWSKRMADFFEELVSFEPDTSFAIENLYDREVYPFVELFEELEKRKIELNNVGMCLDIGHAACNSKHAPERWQEALLPYIIHYHLHDNNLEKDEHLALGEGKIKLESFLARANKEASFTIENSSLSRTRASISYLENRGYF